MTQPASDLHPIHVLTIATPLVLGFLVGWWAKSSQQEHTTTPPVTERRYELGGQGLLLMDTRNGETWFLSKEGWQLRAAPPREVDRLMSEMEAEVAATLATNTQRRR